MTTNNVSWDNVEEVCEDDDQYEQLCQSSKPSDFYFTTANENNDVVVYITPAVYFDETGACWDQHMNIDHLLPAYLSGGCEMEGVWAPSTDDKSRQEITNDMLSLGFLTNDQFSLMVKEVATAYESECEDMEAETDYDMRSFSDNFNTRELEIENDDSEYNE